MSNERRVRFGETPSLTPPPPPQPSNWSQPTQTVTIPQLQPSQQLIAKLMKDVEELQAEVTALRIDNSSLQTRILNYNNYHPGGCMNRHNFNLFMIAARDRPATNQEWQKFCETFYFDFDKFTGDVYNWIEANAR